MTPLSMEGGSLEAEADSVCILSKYLQKSTKITDHRV